MAGRPLSYLASVPVDRVKNIGPARAKALAGVDIYSVADLLLHVPRRYLDRSQLYELAVVPLGEEVTVAGTVTAVRKRRISRGRTMIDAVIRDGTDSLTAVWFNPYLRIREDTQIILSGKVERFRGRLQMKSPAIDSVDQDSLITGRVVPIHPAIGGFKPDRLREAIANALDRSRPIADTIPEDIIERAGLISRDDAIANIHFPESQQLADMARSRLVFDELFRLEVALARQQHILVNKAIGVAHDGLGSLLPAFLGALPYTLTGAQERVITEICADMKKPHPMHRLLQGEVGSGKTVVAIAAMLTAIQGGYQGAVMAPTEVLAEQHFLSIDFILKIAGLKSATVDLSASDDTKSLFGQASDEVQPQVRLALLTANSAEVNFLPSGTVSRENVLAWIADGTVDLVVGTHTLIQKDLMFYRLGAAVVDEQHRFGVYQRVSLRDKAEGYDPDLLIMTATPIPRTLAMTLYGDLDLSLLDEMPPGRSPVHTSHIVPDKDNLEEVYDFVRRQVAAGRQIFVVCPLVDDSDKLEAVSATAEFNRLKKVFPRLKLGLLHGQMRPSDKEEVMAAFRERRIDLLVSTSVIEVGIDMPNASVMIVEDADRFGLSQLHQLRGRVGRAEHISYCFLVARPSTMEAERRISAMVASNDGFYLAERDLEIRGQGTVFGTQQAGMKDLKLADILRDKELLISARCEAFALIERDPELTAHSDLSEEIRTLLGEDVAWLFVS